MSKDMILSLNGDTFQTLKDDFDTILARTIGNMTMKGADEATITLKLSVSLEKSSVGTVSGIQDVTKPSFKHDISSVMQVKDKMTGQFKGEYGMIWDEDEERWVLRKIDNGQMSIFDNEENEIIDADYREVPELPEAPKALPESEQDSDAGDGDDSEPPQNNADTPFGWLCQFIGEDLHITEAMGNYTVRTDSNKVVLSSATSPDSPFYCSAEKLAPHVGHQVVCAGYGQDHIVNVSVECEDCSQVLYDLDAPEETEEADEAPLTEEETAEAMDAAAEVVEGIDEAEEGPAEEETGYDYDSPEEE